VRNLPVANAGLARSICAGDPTTLGGTPTATGGSGNYSYLWTPSLGLDDATKDKPVATPAGNTTFQVYVTDINSGCVSTPSSVVVTVNPLPTLTSTLTPPAICSGVVFSYAPASGTAGTSFAWNRATVAGITPVGTTGSGNPNEALTNSTTGPLTVHYIYTLTANSCTNPTTYMWQYS